MARFLEGKRAIREMLASITSRSTRRAGVSNSCFLMPGKLASGATVASS